MGGIIYYGKYTKAQVERANQIDLEELLRRNGEHLLPSGREKRLENDHSVTIRGNQWFDHAAEQGGYALSFVRRYYGLSSSEGMKLLLGGYSVQRLYPQLKDWNDDLKEEIEQQETFEREQEGGMSFAL